MKQMPEVTDAQTAKDFIVWAVETLKGGFHPDTDAEEYVDNNDLPVFGEDEALQYDENMLTAFHYLGSDRIYEVAIPLMKKEIDGYYRL